MSDRAELEDLVTHLVQTSRLSRPEAVRLVGEVLSFLDESAEDFIRRRHRALQSEGRPNEEIFTRIAAEMARRRFRAPDYTVRQIRRVIYG
jgi:hypothetical protein